MESIITKYCSKEWQDFVDLHKTILSFKVKTVIFDVGEQAKGIYIVNKGKVKVVANEVNGKQRLIRLAADGDILGHRGFGSDWAYPIFAIALEQTQLTFIPMAIFTQLVKANSELAYHLIMFFAEELRMSEEKTMQIPVKNRVARALYMNYDAFGFSPDEPGKLSFTLSRRDLAGKAGTTYETVIRELSELNKKRTIKIVGKAIFILNLHELKTLAYPDVKNYATSVM